MLNRVAVAVLIAASLCGAARTAAAQSEGDLSGSRAMAFIGTSDLAQARAFYGQVLGLRIVASDAASLVADAGGVRVRITLQPRVAPAPYTVLGFEVTDIFTITKRLAARGVKFLRLPEFARTQDSAAMWTAPNGDKVVWFKDPDGNMLSLSNGGSGL